MATSTFDRLDSAETFPLPARGEELDRTSTIARFIPALAQAYGERPAVIYGEQTLTYIELDRRSAELAMGLLRRGAGKGARIGIRFGNNPDWVVWWAAVTRIGAVCVPLSTFLRPAELARIVRHADLQGLITARSFLKNQFIEQLETVFPRLKAIDSPELAIEEAPFLRWILVGSDDVRPPGWAHAPLWLAVEDEAHWAKLRRRAEDEVHVEDEAITIYTSGQSAEPKGVVHTHSSVMTKTHYMREMLSIGPSARVEASMPFFWVGGLILSLFPTLDAGAVVVCEDRTRYGIGNQVIGAAGQQENPYSDLRMAPALGMTETFGMYSWGRQWRVPGHAIAAPLDEFQPGFAVKVVDENGRPVPSGVRGEIRVRGPSVASRLQKVDRAVGFDEDGYYRTGDEGERDGDRIHFTGRLGDLIKTSGANVSPAEVEREILSIDGVERAHVVALPDSERAQIVAAAIVPSPGSALTPAKIREFLAERLSSYKVPRKIVFYLSAEDIPMTPTMKINKVALANQLQATKENDGLTAAP